MTMKPHYEIKQNSVEKDPEELPPVIFGYEDPSKNLFRNWDFETDISDSDWRIPQEAVRKSDDAHTGKWSLKLNSNDFQTLPLQRVYNLKRDTNYYYSFFLKFLTDLSEKEYFEVNILIAIKLKNETTVNKEKVSILPYMRAIGPKKAIWQQCGGNFKTPDSDIEYAETQMTIKPHDVIFLLDSASLIELPAIKQWRKASDERIERFRMSNVNLNVTLPTGHSPRQYTVTVKQTKRKFGIGAAINADKFNEDSELGDNYRKCFFDHFEWAVFNNDTKWKPMEPTKNVINFKRVDDAMVKLKERGITVRGHAIHWNKKDNNPDWIQKLKGQEFQDELMRRVNYVVEHYKGQFVQWDVCNEHLQNRYFEETGGNPNQIKVLFDRAHTIDPDVHLFLNDYLVFRSGLKTSGQFNLARSLLAADVPVHGIGVQSHLRHIPIDFAVLLKRAEVIAAAGLPVMVTELSLHSDDVTIRADYLEKALRLYFSIPQIVGVIFWLFSDLPGLTMDDNDMSLFDGVRFEPNEAGKKLRALLKKWRTNETFNCTRRNFTESFRAFHGNYELDVLRNGESIMDEPIEFKVEENEDVEINLAFLTDSQLY